LVITVGNSAFVDTLLAHRESALVESFCHQQEKKGN
jgi:hypothetical protein